MLPPPYSDLVKYLESYLPNPGITAAVEQMSKDDAISMLFSHIRKFVSEVADKRTLNVYLDYGLKSYDSGVISGVIDNDLLDNDMIGKISEQFGIWETIQSLVATNKSAEASLLDRIIKDSEGLGLCVIASRVDLDYSLFVKLVERKDKNANKILLRRSDLPLEWKVLIGLV